MVSTTEFRDTLVNILNKDQGLVEVEAFSLFSGWKEAEVRHSFQKVGLQKHPLDGSDNTYYHPLQHDPSHPNPYGKFRAVTAQDLRPMPRIKRQATPKPKITIESVILAEDKKRQIRSALSQMTNHDLIFNKWGFGAVFEKGTAVTMLFYGIPGTGKTLMAQAIAEEAASELKVVGTADIMSSEPGGAERTITELFTEATARNQSVKTGGMGQVILLDECDSLLYNRNEAGLILGAIINTLLQAIEKYEGILLLTTNRLGRLDPALERRIMAKIEFPFPDFAERIAIWRRLIPAKAPLAPDVTLEELARTPIAGGNIKNAILNAARMAAFEKSKTISLVHFEQAIEKELEGKQQFRDSYADAPHQTMREPVHHSGEMLSVPLERGDA